MQIKGMDLLLSIAALAIAGLSALSQSNPLAIVLAAVVFATIAAVSYRQPEREFYLFAGGEPLAITVGITSLPAGVLIQLVLIGILFGQDITRMKAPALASLLLVPFAIAVFAIFTMSMAQVFVPFLVLLVVLAVLVFIFGIRNRLQKMQYSREEI